MFSIDSWGMEPGTGCQSAGNWTGNLYQRWMDLPVHFCRQAFRRGDMFRSLCSQKVRR